MRWLSAVLLGLVVAVSAVAARAENMRGEQLQYTVRSGDNPAELTAQFGLDSSDIPSPLIAGKKILLPFVRMEYAEKLARELADRERALIAAVEVKAKIEKENDILARENKRLFAVEAGVVGLEQSVTFFKWAFGASVIVAATFLVVLLCLAYINRDDAQIIKALRAENVKRVSAVAMAEQEAARATVKPKPVRSISAGA